MGVREAWLGGACGLCGVAVLTCAAPPEPDTAVENWYRIRSLIDADALPDASVAPPAGVHAVLRHHGRPIASSWSIRADGEGDPVASAARDLLNQARVDSGLANLPDDLATAGLRSATLEVETAGAFTPMTGPTLQSVSDRLNPAVHGIALRKGTEWIVRFPSALRLTGSAATLSTLHELAAVLGYTPEALDAARRSGQVTLYGFETIDLVQFADGSPPGIFERGGIGRSPDVSIGNVRSKLGQVGRHLLTHVWTDPDGGSTLAGTYFPMSDRYRPVQAEDRDVALAILALDRLGDDDALPGVSPAAAEARDALLRTIGVEDPIVAAIHVGLGRAGEEATALVASTLDDQNQPRLTRAIAAWALASQPQCSDRVRRFLLETASSPPEEIESLLPWIGWADVGCAAEAEATPLLLATWRSLPGRFSEALTASQRPPAARLTSNLLRQAAFLPTALGTCDDPALAAASLEDIDFLLNALIVGETEASLTRAPSSTLGGVRTAAWDERMTIPTQAFAILLLDDMVERMEVGEAAGMAEVDP